MKASNKTNKQGHFKAWFSLCNYALLHFTQTKPHFKMPVIGDVMCLSLNIRSRLCDFHHRVAGYDIE